MDSNLFIPTDAEGSHGVAGCRTEGSRRFDVRREKEGGGRHGHGYTHRRGSVLNTGRGRYGRVPNRDLASLIANVAARDSCQYCGKRQCTCSHKKDEETEVDNFTDR